MLNCISLPRIAVTDKPAEVVDKLLGEGKVLISVSPLLGLGRVLKLEDGMLYLRPYFKKIGQEIIAGSWASNSKVLRFVSQGKNDDFIIMSVNEYDQFEKTGNELENFFPLDLTGDIARSFNSLSYFYKLPGRLSLYAQLAGDCFRVSQVPSKLQDFTGSYTVYLDNGPKLELTEDLNFKICEAGSYTRLANGSTLVFFLRHDEDELQKYINQISPYIIAGRSEHYEN